MVFVFITLWVSKTLNSLTEGVAVVQIKETVKVDPTVELRQGDILHIEHVGIVGQAPDLGVAIGEIVYLLDSEMDSDDGPIIVINLIGNDAIFNTQELKTSILERIITATRSIYTDSVVIPTGWRSHREGGLFSIQAPSRDKSWRKRLHFDTRPRDSHDLFVFSKTNDILDFDNLDHHLEIYDVARKTLVDAILAAPPSVSVETMAGITLSQQLPQGFTQGASLDQWYQSRLTQEQRIFVDKPYDGPVRLRGSAGTGKTLSLVIKFIRDGLAAQKRGESTKLGFLVHSYASVDLVRAIAESLDTTGLLQHKTGNCRLEIRTLYDLAYDNLRFNLDALSPLSLDGREGNCPSPISSTWETGNVNSILLTFSTSFRVS